MDIYFRKGVPCKRFIIFGVFAIIKFKNPWV